MNAPQSDVPSQAPSSGVDDVVRMALALPGVVAVRVESAGAEGGSLVRLELAPSAQVTDVAAAMDEALAARPPAPRQADATAPAATTPGARAASSRPRTGRISVPSVASPTVAATPAPQWLGEEVAAGAATPQAPDPVRPRAARRWRLDRLDVGVDRLTTRASVTLADEGVVHTGIAEAPATASGSARAVAAATVRALESAAAGAVRADVDGISLAEVGGRRAAVVVLDVATSGGAEQLVGAALVDRDDHRGVVRAVLDAANRRLFRST